MLTVTREPEGLGVFGTEHCCLCDRPTPYWYTPKDVALCQECAPTASADQVPSKRQWCEDQRRRHPPLVANPMSLLAARHRG